MIRMAERDGIGISTAWPRLVLLIMLVLLSAMSCVRAEPPLRVVLVLSDTSEVYREVAQAFETSLTGRFSLRTYLLGEPDLASWPAEAALMVTVGAKATRAAGARLEEAGPVLALLVPRDLAPLAERGSAVYVDQPPERYLAFVRMVMPKARKVGVLVSGEGSLGMRVYAATAARQGLELVVGTAANRLEVPRVLQGILAEVDVLMLIPDTEVVNEYTVRQILIASYRQKIPVIGFSRGLAHAGAVASLVSSPSAIGRQGAALAKQWNPATGALPPAAYADDYEMIFNRQVARSLDVALPGDPDTLESWRRLLSAVNR